MFEYVKATIDFLAQHPEISYSLVFLAATFESMPLLGSVVPGSTIILAVSATAPSGAVSFWPLVFWSVLGAVIGDGASYWLGRRYQRRILSTWPCSRYPQLAVKSEAFFAKHGGKSVVIGRFTPALRPFIPLFAGILDMPPRRFYVANILSALLWAPAHIIPGIALGATLGLAAAVVGRLVGLGAIVVVTLWGATLIAKYIVRQALPHVTRCIIAVRLWASAGDSLIKRQMDALLDPERNEARAIGLVGIVLIGATWLFLGALEDVVTGDPLVRADRAVYSLLQSFRSSTGDALMTTITEMGDSLVVISVVCAATAWLLFRRAWRSALYLLVAVAGASLFNSGIKLILSRERPISDLYDGVSAFSFPSGHATVNFALYGFICVLILRNLSSAWRLPVVGLVLSLVTLIALSRLYLGAHWFSDVLAGLSFGVAWIALLGTGYQAHRQEMVEAKGLLAVVCAALITGGGLNAYLHYPTDVERYAPRSTTQQMSSAQWMAGGWQEMPVRRTDLIGEYEGPLTVQLVGDLDSLEQELLAHGWIKPRALSLANSLTWIESNPDPALVPTIPLLHEGLAPSLTLIYVQSASSRLVFRLWRTGTVINSTGATQKHLWIGAATQEELRPLIWPLTITAVKPDANTPRDSLIGLIPNSVLARRTSIHDSKFWDGQVLLMSSESL
ncbi:MAG TPA: VTT domain-containing protein [Dongiaceae bacterium]|nr:VTT domain-containing protein [Dongiaceae bacterium]